LTHACMPAILSGNPNWRTTEVQGFGLRRRGAMLGTFAPRVQKKAAETFLENPEKRAVLMNAPQPPRVL